MKIGIGDYVRTKRGLIGKIVNISTFREPCMKYGIEASYLNDTWYIGDNDIKLVKQEPIDLIEEGDYVNGYRVEYICDDGVYVEVPFVDSESIGCNANLIRPENIKTITTKEQFSSIEYRIGE